MSTTEPLYLICNRRKTAIQTYREIKAAMTTNEAGQIKKA
jgi:hypothetical protein